MAVSLKHTTQTATPDSGDGKISHDAWNEEHTLTLATDKLLGRVSASTGAAEEVTFTDFAQSLLDDANAAAARSTLGDVATLTDENQTLTGGVTVTEKDLGTISSGTLTLDLGDRPIQKYVNNGAHTLAPGTTVGSALIVITNGASAGAITTSGWTHVAGNAFTTTNADKFVCSATVNAAGSLLVVQQMQGTETGGGLTDISGDTTPTLGGSLDGGGFDITNVDDATFDSLAVTDDAYDATTWNGSTLVPTKNALRDKIETLQPLDSDLTSWAGVTRASGFDTFATTPTSANLDSLVTDDTGSGALVFATTPTLVTPILGTPTSGTLTSCTGLPAAGVVGTAATLTVENQALTGGVEVTEKDLGTVSSGTLTVDLADRPIQKYTNNGAHTLAPGTPVGSALIVITNGASAGAVSTSGWTHVAGAFTTTNADKFVCSASVSAVGSLLTIQKMQGTDGGGITEVADDTSPTLGGSLDGGGFDITNIDDATFDTLTVTDDAYDATGWNGSALVPTKNAVRDKIETLQPLDSDLTSWAGVTRASGFDTFATTPTSANLDALLTDDTGSGACVFADTPTLIAPLLGTPTSGTLTNCTGLPAAGVVGGALVTGGALGTPSSGTLTNCTGLPTMVVANEATDTTCFITFTTAASGELGPKTNANLPFNSNTGVLTLTAPVLGTPTSGTLTNCTALPVAGITSSTSTALGVGSLELGNASDTTLARQAAGHVTVEGVPVGTMRYAFVPTGSDFTLGANANVQAYLPAANDVFTTVANTTYFFETMVYLTTGATTHTTAFGLLGAGTATVASTLWQAIASSVAIGTQQATSTHTFGNVATAVVLNATSIVTTTTFVVRGQFRISTGGTIIPSLQFSANPTGTNLSKAGTYFRCWPVLSDTTAAAGAWA